jgi:RNA polymerase-binding transcription factor DksA
VKQERHDRKTSECRVEQVKPVASSPKSDKRKASVRRNTVSPKWAWHFRTLIRLRERLLRERGVALKDAAEPMEARSMSSADSGTDEFDHDMVLRGLSSGQDLLFEVDEALGRLVDGSYGKCQESGRPIPAIRLRALPWTRFSKEVQARLEAEGAVHSAAMGALGTIRGKGRGSPELSNPSGPIQSTAPADESLRVVSASDLAAKHIVLAKVTKPSGGPTVAATRSRRAKRHRRRVGKAI